MHAHQELEGNIGNTMSLWWLRVRIMFRLCEIKSCQERKATAFSLILKDLDQMSVFFKAVRGKAI